MGTKTLEKRETLPPLESGDVLSHEEFWRIYSERHDIRKAEHIKGVVYAPSPVSDPHARPHFVLNGWLAAYALPRGIYGSDNITTFLPATGSGEDDTVQPDLLILDREGSKARLNDDGYIEGAPDLVVEIAASSASYDLHVKKDLYEAAGVREYIVWRTYDEAVDWFRLEDGKYRRIEPEDGLIESAVFPGLVLDVEALLSEDYATVFSRVFPTGTDAATE